MANKKSLKSAIIASVIAMVLSVTTLFGTTFAWFTDSVTNTNNVIKSGNLDVELSHSNTFGYDETIAEKVEADTKLFLNTDGEQILWEPGVKADETFRIQNMGSLALKYELRVKSAFETVTEDGKKLSDVLSIDVKSDNLDETVAFGNGYVMEGTLKANESVDYYVAIAWTPSAIDNEYNVAGGLSMVLAIDLVATQTNLEKDGFNGDNYDAAAEFPVITHSSSIVDIADIVKNGGNVSFSEDIEAPLTYSTIYGTPAALIQKGGVIDGNNKSLDIINPEYNGYAIETYGGTIKNLIIDSPVGRGIVISSPTEDIVLDNVYIDGPGYAVNTTEHNAKKLTVSNSTIKGWTSLAGLSAVVFNECNFGENTYKYWQKFGYSQDFDRLIRPYVGTEFNDCVFEKDYYIDLSALGTACKITLNACTVNGVVLTESNFSDYITIELPSGRTIADCVIFA